MRVLMEMWPALVPILLYAAWMALRRGRASRRGAEKPAWRDGPWFWAVMASIAVAIVCLVLWGLSADPVRGRYVPPHMENGTLVPGIITHE